MSASQAARAEEISSTSSDIVAGAFSIALPLIWNYRQVERIEITR